MRPLLAEAWTDGTFMPEATAIECAPAIALGR